MFNIRLLYKKNSKSLIFLALLAFLSLYSGYHYYHLGHNVAAIQELKKVSLALRLELSKDLKGKCSVFKSSDWLNFKKDFLKNSGLGVDLIKDQSVLIDKLSFDRVYLRLYYIDNSNHEYVTTGYLVTNTDTKNCYGVI